MDTEAATEQDIAEAVGAGAPQLLANPKRPHCARCHRPVRVCMCHALPPARLRTAGRTRVVILQSHKEATRRQQISTILVLVGPMARTVGASTAFGPDLSVTLARPVDAY